MKIYVVIPNWNGADMITKCLQSLKNQTQKHCVVVVDNASEDSSIYLIEKDFPDVVLLKNSVNKGFAGGVNNGIRYALDQGANAIALLNNDAVVDKNWLKNLANTLVSEEKYGIVTCKLLREDKKHIDSTGDFYSTRGIPFPRGRNQIDKKQFDKEKDVFGASGGASIYKGDLLNEIGLFDETFFAYYEDVDISFRAQLAGWKIMYEPSAIAYHAVGATSSKMGDFTRYHSIKNFLLLYTKDMPAKLYWKYLPVFLYQFLRTTARSILDGKFIVWLRAVGMFIKLLPTTLRSRITIQKSRKVSVGHIENILYTQKPPKIPKY